MFCWYGPGEKNEFVGTFGDVWEVVMMTMLCRGSGVEVPKPA